MTDYRYILARDVGDIFSSREHGTLCWAMLNPSTADDTLDDPTIRRVKRFTLDAGARHLEVVNLFAARATRPKRLYENVDPVGELNDYHIGLAFNRADHVVFAWGASGGPRARRRAEILCDLAAEFKHTPLCLGVTATGEPRHPLYVRADQPLVPYP